MALFHLSVTQTKRSAGQSAIASAAYRAGERLYSEYYGEYSDLSLIHISSRIHREVYVRFWEGFGQTYGSNAARRLIPTLRR